MQAKDPKYVIVVDQGSREAPSIVESPSTKCMVIDHHLSDKFPQNATVRTRIDPLILRLHTDRSR